MHRKGRGRTLVGGSPLVELCFYVGKTFLKESFSPHPFQRTLQRGFFIFRRIVRSTVVLWYLKPTTRVILSGVRLRTQSKPVGLPSIAKVGSRVVEVKLSVRDPATACRAPRSTPLRSAQDDTDGLCCDNCYKRTIRESPLQNSANIGGLMVERTMSENKKIPRCNFFEDGGVGEESFLFKESFFPRKIYY